MKPIILLSLVSISFGETKAWQDLFITPEPEPVTTTLNNEGGGDMGAMESLVTNILGIETAEAAPDWWSEARSRDVSPVEAWRVFSKGFRDTVTAMSKDVTRLQNYLEITDQQVTEFKKWLLGDGSTIGGSAMLSGRTSMFDLSPQSRRGMRLLKRSLASQAQLNERGIVMAGAGHAKQFRDAARVARDHGGNPSDWAKMKSSSYTTKKGTKFETHWVENIKTGQKVEEKIKFQHGI